MILITHDLGVIADVAQSVMVMYAGRGCEIGDRNETFQQPLHPYTWGLLESIPTVDSKGTRLIPIEGSPPSLINEPAGCAFHPRCPHRFEPCDKERPELVDRGGGHPEACHLTIEEKKRLWDRARGAPNEGGRYEPGSIRHHGPHRTCTAGDALVEVENLTKHFPITQGIIFQKQIAAVHAVEDVSSRSIPARPSDSSASRVAASRRPLV